MRPMGFIATTLPPQIPVLRIDGWMVQPRDGTKMTRDMMAPRGGASGGGRRLYLIADAADMARARDALADYQPGHPLAGMPAIRHQPDRHLSMVPAGEKIMNPTRNRRPGALLQRGSRHRHGGARLPRRPARRRHLCL